MKSIYYTLSCVLCSMAILSHAQSLYWSAEMYNKYTYINYTDYKPFNQSIEDSGFDIDLMEAAIFYETNRQRILHDVPQLSFDYNLMVCAHNHSVDMVQYDFFSHKSPVPDKTTMRDRLAQVGYFPHASAENIAYCSLKDSYVATAKHLVIEQWMNSTGHRRNILNGDYTYLGCGAAFYVDGSFIYVKATQNFMQK